MARAEKFISESEESYSQLKVITDAAQAGELKPWSHKVIELLSAYGVAVDRRNGIKAEVTLSFPTSTKNRSMAIGVRHLKPGGSWAEDFFLFEENVGLTCYYRGLQEKSLPEYKGTHHGPPSVALQESIPSIQQDLDELKSKLQLNEILNSIDMALVVTPEEHTQNIQAISIEYQQAVQSLVAQTHGFTPASTLSMKLQPMFTRKRTEQMQKWAKSESIYDLKLAQISSIFPEDSQEFRSAIDSLNALFGKK